MLLVAVDAILAPCSREEPNLDGYEEKSMNGSDGQATGGAPNSAWVSAVTVLPYRLSPRINTSLDLYFTRDMLELLIMC